MNTKLLQNKANIPSSLSDFEILHILGKGSFGTVFKVRHKITGQLFALKQIPLTLIKQKEKDNSLNEIRILASLSSPYIISYQDSFFDGYCNTLNIIMEYADSGDLEQLINKKKNQKVFLSESQAMQYIIPIVKGLKALHENLILHRDLKMANIFLFKNGEVKIGDMNVSKVYKNELKSTQTGTPYYACPEVWNNSCYDYKADIWSLGCLLYELVMFKAPFRGTTLKMVFDQVTEGRYDPMPQYLTERITSIIKKCLNVNPQMRPTIQEIDSMLDISEGLSDDDDNKREKLEKKDNQLISTICMDNKVSWNEMNMLLPKKAYKRSRQDEAQKNYNSNYYKEKISPMIINYRLMNKNMKILPNINAKKLQLPQYKPYIPIKTTPNEVQNYHYQKHNKDKENLELEAKDKEILSNNSSRYINHSHSNANLNINEQPKINLTEGADNKREIKRNFSENCYNKITNIRNIMSNKNRNKNIIPSSIESLQMRNYQLQQQPQNYNPSKVDTTINTIKSFKRPYSVNIRQFRNKSENMNLIFNHLPSIYNDSINTANKSDLSTNDIAFPPIKPLKNSNNYNLNIFTPSNNTNTKQPNQYNSSQIANVLNYYYPYQSRNLTPIRLKNSPTKNALLPST